MKKLALAAALLAMAGPAFTAPVKVFPGAYMAGTQITLPDGTVAYVMGSSGVPDQRTFTLASNQTLAAGVCGTPVLVDVSAQYGWLNQIVTGTSPSVTLKFRGPDGSTYITSTYVATATGSQFVPITAGSVGSYVEACNTGSNPVTLYSTLSS